MWHNKMLVMVNDINGNLGGQIARAVMKQQDMELLPITFTGSEREDGWNVLEGTGFRYRSVTPEKRKEVEDELANKVFIAVDATLGPATGMNVDWYCNYSTPFVMGTTGGDGAALEERVKKSAINAVISSNMAKQIVEFQEMLRGFSYEFEGKWIKDDKSGLYIKESHQEGKKDTSGTAKDVVKSFNRMGIGYDENDIVKIRNKEDQRILGVPEWALNGHGWHRYILHSEGANRKIVDALYDAVYTFITRDPVFSRYGIYDKFSGLQKKGAAVISPDNNVMFRVEYAPGETLINHNVNGRSIYVEGFLDAIRYLEFKEGKHVGKVFSMVDVTRNR